MVDNGGNVVSVVSESCGLAFAWFGLMVGPGKQDFE